MLFDDTIAAIATPLGEGGLAVVRVSGKDALAVADKCFSPTGKSSSPPSAAASHTIHYGKIIRPLTPIGGEGVRRTGEGEVIDEVLVAVMRAPRTFTREDTVEITCHGGVLATKLVLDAVLAAGARAAEPGEFTKRAFLNGRIDLAQAEAVADLIHSRTELALSAANEQLAGKLSQRINQLRDDLMKTLAHVEAYIDFPEEDIPEETSAQLLARLERGVAFMDELLATADEGQILRRGVRAAIVGRPNVGKSSLLNQLLGHDRAIVSPIAGTTRDTIEETANIRGVPVVFIDTAGLRESEDVIEQEGVRRSRASLEKAEFILHVLDASEPLAAEDEKLLAEFAGKKRILVRNKIDLPQKLTLTPALSRPTGEGAIVSASREVDVCCLSGKGIEALKDAIKALVWSGAVNGESWQVAINARHQDALRRGREAVVRATDLLRAGETLELPAADLHVAVNAVGEIVGKTTTEDLLDMIFSQFCIGK